jgi:hypothetical protein
MTLFLIISSILILADTPDSLVFRYSLKYKQNIINDIIFIEIEGGTYPQEDGLPELPHLRKKILIPIDGSVEVKYHIESIEQVKGIPNIVQFYGNKYEMDKPKVYKPLPVKLQRHRSSPFGNATLLIYPFAFNGEFIEKRNSILIKIYFLGDKWIKPDGYQERLPYLFLNKIRGESIRKRAFKGVPKAGLWAKVKTTKEGIYEITPDDLINAGLSPTSIDPNKIEIRHCYTGVLKWDMDSIVNLDTVPQIIPTIYETDGDGSFELGERIIFFAHSLSGWGKNYFTENKYFYYNPFADTNAYWLYFDGDPLIMEEVDLTGGVNVSYFIDTIHLERDIYSPLRSGLVWGWKELNTSGGISSSSILSTAFTAYQPFDNEAILRIAFYPENSNQYIFRTSLNGTIMYDTVATTGNPRIDRTIFTIVINDLSNGINELEITLQTLDESIIIDYVEAIYKRKTFSIDRKLEISSDTNTTKHYNVNNLSINPYIIDFSNTENPHLISHTWNDGAIEFSSNAEKILIQESPYSIEGISIKDPTTLLQGGADWIIITPNEFISVANTLKSWRNKHLRSFLSPITKVITLNEIYDNFSFGVRDPTAIKRFLYHTQIVWNPSVSYVFLFGDGSYDEKNLSGIGKTSYIPIHTKGTTILDTSPYLVANPCWDNWYVDFNEDQIQDIPIGRVTASDLTEATSWVNKLIDYESSSGLWRMNAILLADDAFVGSREYKFADRVHTTGSESISDLMPKWLFKKKVYLMEYPIVGGEKPGAEEAHLKAMGEGALVAIFLGHGNLRRLTHESVFLLQDVSRFQNWRKIPIYFFGSCDVGYFERVDENCIAGYSNIYSDGGTIVSIAAGRATTYSENPALGRAIINNLFSTSVNTAGDAFLLAKEATSTNKTYTYFGDPATSIIIDTTIISSIFPDTAIGGERFHIRGEIQTTSNKIFCLVTESNYDTALDTREGTDVTPNYITIEKIGKKLFQGSAPIRNDSFDIKINLPLDINEQEGNIYLFSRGEKDAHLNSKIQFVPGTEIIDNIPPEISFQIKGKDLREEDLIPPYGEMTVVIRDSSGIDMRSKINLQVKINDSEPIYLVDNFNYHSGSSTTGEASFPYEEPILVDTINFEVFAKDNFGNIGSYDATFRIGEEELLWGVENYPNPMKDKTTIIYYLGREVNVEIKIFTIAGRLVKELHTSISRYGINYAEWDGRDERGRKVSNGIYYYMIKPEDEDAFYGKIAVIR